MCCKIGQKDKCNLFGCAWKNAFGFSCIEKFETPKQEINVGYEYEIDPIELNEWIEELKIDRFIFEESDSPIHGKLFDLPKFIQNKRNTRRDVYNKTNGVCYLCNQYISYRNFTIEHVYPRSKGGINHFSNLLPACYECNIKKGSRLPTERELEILKKWNTEKQVPEPKLSNA